MNAILTAGRTVFEMWWGSVSTEALGLDTMVRRVLRNANNVLAAPSRSFVRP